jgi:hypothetical protein
MQSPLLTLNPKQVQSTKPLRTNPRGYLYNLPKYQILNLKKTPIFNELGISSYTP